MVLVIVDNSDGVIDDLTFQALTLGRQLAADSGQPLEALVTGDGATGAAAGLGSYGVTTAHVVVHPQMSGFAPAATARAAAQLVGQGSVRAVVASGSGRSNEVMAHLGAMTDQPVAADCLTVTLGAPTTVTRARWGGSLVEEAVLHADIALLTVAPHAVAAETVDGVSAAVVPFTPELEAVDLAVHAVPATTVESSGAVSLADAKVIVSGGRGVGSAEGFAVLEELAGLLGGTIGCSRVVTGNGWRPHKEQVGQTGTKVAPDLYIACGISGATQHLAGCRNSKTILVINNDAEAPIMGHADYAVIGDLHKILPAIIEETRKAKA
ncbi:MAG: electron transfer flavoprotein subunit alpha/FixB family protein [Actinomycetes bacterium]